MSYSSMLLESLRSHSCGCRNIVLDKPECSFLRRGWKCTGCGKKWLLKVIDMEQVPNGDMPPDFAELAYYLNHSDIQNSSNDLFA